MYLIILALFAFISRDEMSTQVETYPNQYIGLRLETLLREQQNGVYNAHQEQLSGLA